MRLDPSLQVFRLYIESHSSIAYDERFHLGVNIIRGANSSGKSTILNFLMYALGADIKEWSTVAKKCSRVSVEVKLNGNLATLSREISESSSQPMELYSGNLEASLKATRADWTKYPYSRSVNRESFSQILFRLLGIPEASGDASENITIHQVLRLLYADQLSPVEQIFKFEPFDPPSKRDAVGRLMCGVYDDLLYKNELKLRELEKSYSVVTSEHRSLIEVLGKTEESIVPNWIASEKSILHESRFKLQLEIENVERKMFVLAGDDELSLVAQNSAYSEVQALQHEIGGLRDQHDNLSLAIQDSTLFVANLEQKRQALNDSSLVAEHLGIVEFQSCPACLASIEVEVFAHACHLCKTPFESDRLSGRITALINDTALQLRQSKLLQVGRVSRLEKVSESLANAEVAWKRAAIRLQQARHLPSTKLQERLRELNQKIGYIDRDVEDLERKARIADLVAKLAMQKATLNAEITTLKTENQTRQEFQKKRLNDAYTAISKEIKGLLKGDLERQVEFKDPQHIQFDFGANSIAVDNVSYLSASSRAVLKSSFFVGMLAAASRTEFFRHPRFLILDTIEDKGMEPLRSQNFQRQLVALSEGMRTDHQIIFATAMIAPELDIPEYTVGRSSTQEKPTLLVGF